MDSSISQNEYSLPARLEKIEAEFAVLRNETIGEFRWPIKNLPANLQIGETVHLKITTQENEEEAKYARMRRLLEELIN